MPAHARTTTIMRDGDPATSDEAAASVKDLPETQRKVLMVLSNFDSAIDETIIVAFHQRYGRKTTEQSIRSRRKELVKLGKVEFANDYGTTSSGGKSQKWRLA